MEKIGRYEIIKELGQGGMGLVYKAFDPYLNCHVALKVISPNIANSRYKNTFERFLKEAQILAKLNHPNIVRIFDISPSSSPPYISMEFVEGNSFDKIINSKTKITNLKKIDYVIKIVEGLSVIHKASLIHRDLKPANIMITNDDKIKIMDFGISKDLSDNNPQTMSQEIIGSPSYMSPEQVKCEKIDKRADLFSFGTILYELMTGENPFIDKTLAETLRNVMSVNISKLNHFKNLDNQLKKIIKTLLDQNPSNRYASCNQLIIDLKKYRSFLNTNANSKTTKAPIKTFIFTLLLFLTSLYSYQHFKKKKNISKQNIITSVQNAEIKNPMQSENLQPSTEIPTNYTDQLGICGDHTCSEFEQKCFPDCRIDNCSSKPSFDNSACRELIAIKIQPFVKQYPLLTCGDKKCNVLEKHCGICNSDCQPIVKPSPTSPRICLFLSAFPFIYNKEKQNDFISSRYIYEKCAFKSLRITNTSTDYSDIDTYTVELFKCLRQNSTSHIDSCFKQYSNAGNIPTDAHTHELIIMCLILSAEPEPIHNDLPRIQR